MKISIDTDAYNDRRYGRPWIARVDFSAGAKGDFAFGEWCGQAGESGTLYLDAQAGDVIATGQKDGRNPRKSAPDFFVVGADGELDEISKADAFKHWQANSSKPAESQLATISTADLVAELQRRGITASAEETL